MTLSDIQVNLWLVVKFTPNSYVNSISDELNRFCPSIEAILWNMKAIFFAASLAVMNALSTKQMKTEQLYILAI